MMAETNVHPEATGAVSAAVYVGLFVVVAVVVVGAMLVAEFWAWMLGLMREFGNQIKKE